MSRRRKNITGAEVVERALRNISPLMAREIAAALNKGGEEIRERAKQLAPERTGELKDAIEMRDMEYRETRLQVFGKSMLSRRFGVRVGVFPTKNGGRAWYARLVEFGAPRHNTGDGEHPGTSAQPFLFPSYWSLRRRVMGRVNRAVNKAAREAFRGRSAGL